MRTFLVGRGHQGSVRNLDKVSLSGVVATIVLLAGCSTTSTIVVAKDGADDTIVQVPLFKDCPGTTFQVTRPLRAFL